LLSGKSSTAKEWLNRVNCDDACDASNDKSSFDHPGDLSVYVPRFNVETSAFGAGNIGVPHENGNECTTKGRLMIQQFFITFANMLLHSCSEILYAVQGIISDFL
jgi:hypothetical protein